MTCCTAGNFEAGNSLNLAVTAVVGQHLRVTVHCYPRANGRNIVGCYMLRPFAHPVAMLLPVALDEKLNLMIFALKTNLRQI